jgi:hypothetical protein
MIVMMMMEHNIRYAAAIARMSGLAGAFTATNIPGSVGDQWNGPELFPSNFFFIAYVGFWDQCGRKSEEEPVPGALPGTSDGPRTPTAVEDTGSDSYQTHPNLSTVPETGPPLVPSLNPSGSSDGTPFKMGWWDQFGMAKQLLGQHTMGTGRRGPI